MTGEPIELRLARYVDDQHIGLRLNTNLFVGWMEDEEEPVDEWVLISHPYTSHAGTVSGDDPASPYDTFLVTVQSRGTPVLGPGGGDSQSGRQNAIAVYNILHMLDAVYVSRNVQPDEDDVLRSLVDCRADGPPRLFTDVLDDRKRPVWTNNYTVTVRTAGGLRDGEGR